MSKFKQVSEGLINLLLLYSSCGANVLTCTQHRLLHFLIITEFQYTSIYSFISVIFCDFYICLMSCTLCDEIFYWIIANVPLLIPWQGDPMLFYCCEQSLNWLLHPCNDEIAQMVEWWTAEPEAPGSIFWGHAVACHKS